MIPKDKINGERFGQLIFNAICSNRFGDAEIADKLYYIENSELEKLIKEYLEGK